jgi:uncharacterized protein
VLRVILSLAVVAACAGRSATTTTPATPAGIAWPTQLDHPSTKMTHREAALLVLDSSGLQPLMTSMIDVSLDSQLKVNPILVPYKHVMREFLAKYLSYEAIRDELADVYVARFNELQLRQIAAFYATPTGKLAVSVMPEMAQLGAQLGRKHVEDHQSELMEMLKKAERDRSPDY